MSEASILFPNLGLVLKNVGKTFEVFGLEIAFYGVVIALAMLLGINGYNSGKKNRTGSGNVF